MGGERSSSGKFFKVAQSRICDIKYAMKFAYLPSILNHFFRTIMSFLPNTQVVRNSVTVDKMLKYNARARKTLSNIFQINFPKEITPHEALNSKNVSGANTIST